MSFARARAFGQVHDGPEHADTRKPLTSSADDSCEPFTILRRRYSDMTDECASQRIRVGKSAMLSHLLRRLMSPLK